YTVEVLSPFDEKIQDYVANLVIEIHALGCATDSDSGYLAGYNNATGVDALQACLVDHYEQATNLSAIEENYDISDSSSSYIFDDVDSFTPTLVLSTGVFNADRDLILNAPEIVVSGIVSTVSCFLPVANYDDMSPMLIATRDIPF